ncbi:MAG TPA: serine/threonine protein phosphatase [Opitutaceae bacterium]|jgi:hypothetical protein
MPATQYIRRAAGTARNPRWIKAKRRPRLQAEPPAQTLCPDQMHEMKDTARALVRISYDGKVHKTFRGHLAKERFEQEVRVLEYLEKRGCPFVPRLLEADPAALKIVTSNCGTRVDQVNPQRQKELFDELETYGVRHEDADLRNITYRASDGRFCLIDFEFATIIGEGESGPSLKPSVAQ